MYIFEKIKEFLNELKSKPYFYWFLNGLKGGGDIKKKIFELDSRRDELSKIENDFNNIKEKKESLEGKIIKLEELKEENTKVSLKLDLENQNLKDLNIEQKETITSLKSDKEKLREAFNRLKAQSDLLGEENTKYKKEVEGFNQLEKELRNKLNEEETRLKQEHQKLMQEASNYYNSGREFKAQYEAKLKEEEEKKLQKWRTIHIEHEHQTENYFKTMFESNLSVNTKFSGYTLKGEKILPDVGVEFKHGNKTHLIIFDAKTSRHSPEFELGDVENSDEKTNKKFSEKINGYIRKQIDDIKKYTKLDKLEEFTLYKTFYLVVPDEYIRFIEDRKLSARFAEYNVEVISLSSVKTVIDYTIKKIEEFDFIQNIYDVQDEEIEKLHKYLVDVTKTAVFSSNINFQLGKFGVNIIDRYENLHDNIKNKISSEETNFQSDLKLDTKAANLNKNLGIFLPDAKEIYEKNEKQILKKIN